jgi:hypothetical protein
MIDKKDGFCSHCSCFHEFPEMGVSDDFLYWQKDTRKINQGYFVCKKYKKDVNKKWALINKDKLKQSRRKWVAKKSRNSKNYSKKGES